MYRKALELKKKRMRKIEGMFLVEGIRMSEEALRSETEIEAVFWDDRITKQGRGRILLGELEKKVRCVEKLPPHKIDRLSDTRTSSGIVLLTRKINPGEVPFHRNRDLMVLEGVADPGNLGTIIRTSEAAGFGGIALSGNCVELYNPKVVRATMGSIFRVQVIENRNPAEIKAICRRLGLGMIGLKPAASQNIFKIGIQNCAYVLGNEYEGLSEDMEKMCDEVAEIPMNETVESLNLAISAALVAFRRYFASPESDPATE